MAKPKKGVVPKQLEDWLMVVEDTKKKHPNIPYSEVLKLAKNEYEKLKKKLGL